MAPNHAPARLVLRWLAGDFELIISNRLLSELTRALSYPKVRARISSAEGSTFVDFLETNASIAADPDHVARRSRDAGDDYLLALAASNLSVVVTGDRDLLALSADLPIYSPAEFLATLDVG